MAKRTKKTPLEKKVTKESVAEKKSLEQKVVKTRTRRKSYVMDLRIHSPSSLGYLGIDGLDTAPALVRLAKVKKIDVIGMTDFYDGSFIDRVVDAATEYKVTVIPGVMIRCAIDVCNEIILACLFPEEADSGYIRNFLNELSVPESAKQNEDFIVPHDFQKVLDTIEKFDGTAFPSRMDQTPYRRLALPVLVEEYGFRGFDLAYYPDSIKFFKEHWPKTEFQLFSFSNANSLAQIGSRISKVKMAKPGFQGLKTVIERHEAM